MASTDVTIAIVGAGPGGLSAGARAKELGISYVVLDRSAHPFDTVEKYQKGKLVMAQPAALPLRSDLPFEAGHREEVLGACAAERSARQS